MNKIKPVIYTHKGSTSSLGVEGPACSVRTQTRVGLAPSPCFLCCWVLLLTTVCMPESPFRLHLWDALISFLDKLGVCVQVVKWFGILNQSGNMCGSKEEQVRKSGYTCQLSWPIQHTADGEERPAWLGTPSSRRKLLEADSLGTQK